MVGVVAMAMEFKRPQLWLTMLPISVKTADEVEGAVDTAGAAGDGVRWWWWLWW